MELGKRVVAQLAIKVFRSTVTDEFRSDEDLSFAICHLSSTSRAAMVTVVDENRFRTYRRDQRQDTCLL
jgi:hypothetical protein